MNKTKNKRFVISVSGQPFTDFITSEPIVFKSWALALFVLLDARSQMPEVFDNAEVITLKTDTEQ